MHRTGIQAQGEASPAPCPQPPGCSSAEDLLPSRPSRGTGASQSVQQRASGEVTGTQQCLLALKPSWGGIHKCLEETTFYFYGNDS